MLEYQLKRSKQKSNNAVLILLAGIVILLAFGGLLTVELILSPDSPEGQAHGAEVPQREALGLEANAPLEGMADSQNIPPNILGVEKIPTPSAQMWSVQPENGRPQTAEEERIAFKSMCFEYESSIKDLVEAPEFAVWETSSQARFLKMKNRIMVDFGAGEYACARDELAELIRQATKVISERDAAVEESVEQTRIALKENAPQKALAHFSRAQELAPHSPEVLALEVSTL